MVIIQNKVKAAKAQLFSIHGESSDAFVPNFSLYSIDGAIAVDFVGRYENLKEDLHRVLSNIGVEQRLKLPQTNVSLRSKASSYRDCYSPSTRSVVEEWYAPEIELLNYSF